MQIKTDEKQKLVKNVFDPIAKKYDLLNHLLSFGVDIYWRKHALKMTKFPDDARLLDVACGTGDFSIEARKKGINNIFGLDLSHEMIKEFHKKAVWSRGNVAQGVAEHLPFKDNSFSNITVGFGVRNFFDIHAGLTEFHRILKPGGEVTILELKLPKNKLFSLLYTLYFNKILPIIGRIISDNDVSYTYLPNSVAIFDKQVKMKSILQSVGYKNIKIKKLTFGIVQSIIAEK
jgi:demethylmenaquinone methyltransferase/2-methoxy-6-polyprenyl-1,4-benzoquinol methylase